MLKLCLFFNKYFTLNYLLIKASLLTLIFSNDIKIYNDAQFTFKVSLAISIKKMVK